MKIENVTINQNVYAPGGHVGRVVEISQNGQVHLDFGPNNFHYAPFFVGDLAPVSDPCQCAKGDKVRATGKSLTFGDCVEGKIGKIDSLCAFDGVECANVIWESGRENVIPLIQLTKCDPCAGCQKLDQTRLKAFREGRAAEKEATGNAIDVLRKDRDNWKATAQQHCRNATYWREELTKLQKEALKEYATWQMTEIAKCYIRVAPEKLLMSDGARIICELLEGSGPMTSSQIADRLHLLERCILESITESRDVGKIRLVNGKYEIVRD